MGNSLLIIVYILIFSCFLCLHVNLQEILIIDDDMNLTEDEYSNITPSWMQQQLLICIISISVGTLLLFVTFIVPVAIIIRKIRRDKYELDLRELRRISDFM